MVFKINDRRCNTDVASYVFKTSTLRISIANDMSKGDEHFMSKEYCFFDGKVKRCRNFVSLTASTYHPLLKRQIVLAVMEAEHEDSKNIELFWNLFNDALRKSMANQGHHGNSPNMVFNPIGWCTDMAGANMNGLVNVYGEEVLQRIKSCEFHFKENLNKMARKLKSDDDARTFKTLCDDLLTARLKETYMTKLQSLRNFIKELPAGWLDWWDNRRQFIFRAFSSRGTVPHMNQAEVVHASWAHRDRSNMSLLEAAQAEVRDSIMLKGPLSCPIWQRNFRTDG